MNPLSSRVTCVVRATALTACLAVGCCCGTAAAATAELVVSDSPLRVIDGDSDAVTTRLVLDRQKYEELKSADSALLRDFPLSETRSVDLIVDRIEVFAPDARVVLATERGDVPVERPDVLLLGGEVLGEPGSTVFLGLSPHGCNGFVELGQEVFVVSSGRYGEGHDTVVYNLTTLPSGTIDWCEWQCYSDQVYIPGALLWAEAQSQGRADQSLRDAPCRVGEIALETDWEFTGDLFGGDTDASGAYATLLTGAISGVYTRDLNVRLEIVFLRLWPDPDDPWDQDNTGDQLYQFQDYWNAYMTHVERHVAHFLSGRPLGGGIAYYPGLCYPEYDYALSANLAGYFPYPLEDNHPQNWDPYVFAHENGHIFGGPHTHDMSPPIDGCAWGDCSVCPHGTIMSYCHTCEGGMTNIELRFHPRVINEEILPFLQDGAPCDLTVNPVTISDHPDSQTVCLGDFVLFAVAAEGQPPLSYQWRKDELDIPDAMESTYEIEAAAFEDAGVYDVIVTNTCGSVLSDSATLTVEDCCPGDIDGDGDTDHSDLGILLTAWDSQPGDPNWDERADLDGNGHVGHSDLGILLTDWGCGVEP